MLKDFRVLQVYSIVQKLLFCPCSGNEMYPHALLYMEVFKTFLSPTMHKMYVHMHLVYKVWLSQIY